MNAYHNIVNKMQSDEFEGKVSQVYVDEINNKVVVETTDFNKEDRKCSFGCRMYKYSKIKRAKQLQLKRI